MSDTPLSLRAEYESGDTIPVLAMRHGVGRATVYRHLKAAGTVFRARGVRPGTMLADHHARKVPLDQLPALLACAREFSGVAAARRFGISKQRVSQLLRQ